VGDPCIEPTFSEDGGHPVQYCEQGSSEIISEGSVTDAWKERSAVGLYGLM